jgi:branched-chain amino acid aminotransferase
MNVFMVKNGRLITTPSYENILEGVTRRTIMEFAEAELGLKAESRQIDRSELYIADELFFCGTGAQIAPIIEIDRRPVGTGVAGPISTMIKDKYTKICRGEVEQYAHWLTPVYSRKLAKTKI